MRYADKTIPQMAEALVEYRERQEQVQDRLSELPIKNEEARLYAKHGIIRRLITMQWCVDRIFQVLPIDEVSPQKAALLEAAVLVQALLMHASGVMDNLARIWCLERALTDTEVARIRDIDIGLGPRCRQIRASLSPTFRDHLEKCDEWFRYLKNYRDAFAHRIPLYIPPRTLGKEDQQRYHELDIIQAAAWQRGDRSEALRVHREMQSVGRFDAVMMHAFGDKPLDGTPTRLHPQIVCDQATTVVICEQMLAELNVPA
jgi:hypothetical protein